MDCPPIVEIVWEDALVKDSGPWAENKDHVYKPHLVRQVGYLLAHTEEGVILSQAWHPESVAARDQIPIGMVRWMVVLQAAPAPKVRKR
jgi:hypothetical protein